MRNSLTILILLIVTISCDKVESPIERPEDFGNDSVDFPTVDTSNVNVAFQKTYVEEFTGHQCITCPANTRLLIQQFEENKDRMIVTAIHAGGFADVDEDDFPTDFNTEYGTSLFQRYGMGTNPIPSAIINRSTFDAYNGLLIFNQATTFWEGPIDLVNENTSASLGLGLAADYIDSLDLFYIRASMEALEDISDEHRLLVLCLEDSVVAPQLDGTADEDVYPKKIVTDYVHRHVLRQKLSSSQSFSGDEMIAPGETLAAGEWIDYTLNARMPENVVDKNKTTVVALFVNATTDEVIQSEEVHVHVK